MGVLGLKSMVRIKKYKSYKDEIGNIASNVINRDFKAEKPNEKVGDRQYVARNFQREVLT